jgi:hypothetical protein
MLPLELMTESMKPLGITFELEINSQDADFFKQILLFLACGGSCIVKTLNLTSFHMLQMVRVKISASVGRFPVDFGGQCLFPDDQNIKKGSCTV